MSLNKKIDTHAYMINMHKITLNMHKMVLLQMVPHNRYCQKEHSQYEVIEITTEPAEIKHKLFN